MKPIRALESKEDQDKKKKRNQMVIGVILIFLMLASTLGYALQGALGGDSGSNGQNSTALNYNGFEFSYVNGFWIIGNFAFRNSPEDVPDTDIDSALKSAGEYQDQVVYIQSEAGDAEVEITGNLRQLAQRIQEACLSKEGCPVDVPVKTCEDHFIIIREKAESSIRQDNNCVYIEGPRENLVMLADEFLYEILGVK